jgi:hypothetical protein
VVSLCVCGLGSMFNRVIANWVRPASVERVESEDRASGAMIRGGGLFEQDSRLKPSAVVTEPVLSFACQVVLQSASRSVISDFEFDCTEKCKNTRVSASSGKWWIMGKWTNLV